MSRDCGTYVGLRVSQRAYESTQGAFIKWRLVLMARRSPPGVRIKRYGYGRCNSPGSLYKPCGAPEIRYIQLRLVLMARCLPQAVRMKKCGCGHWTSKKNFGKFGNLSMARRERYSQ